MYLFNQSSQVSITPASLMQNLWHRKSKLAQGIPGGKPGVEPK